MTDVEQLVIKHPELSGAEADNLLGEVYEVATMGLSGQLEDIVHDLRTSGSLPACLVDDEAKAQAVVLDAAKILGFRPMKVRA